MDKQEVIKYFGGVSKTAAAVGVTRAAVSKWSARIPWARAMQIERITNGGLRYVDSVSVCGAESCEKRPEEAPLPPSTDRGEAL
jgi:transcriptional repressor of cell division inhibition gene dicB